MYRLFLAILFVVNSYSEVNPSLDVLKQAFSKVIHRRLENGIQIVMYPRKNAPVFAGWISVHVGGVDEKIGMTGISHMLEHMAFKGTEELGTKNYKQEKKLLDKLEELINQENGETINQLQIAEIYSELRKLWNNSEFDNEYRKRGAAEMNATTSKELTSYFISLPKNSFKYWCWVESERIKKPVMRQFYEERDVVKEEKRMRFDDDPQGKLYENILEVAFTQHPYRQPIIGYVEDLNNLTATMTEQFHQQYYVGKNIVISLVGDLNESDLDLVAEYFSDIPNREPPLKDFPKEPMQSGERKVEVTFPAAPHLYVSYHKPSYPNPEDPIISVMLEIFAGSSISPLYKGLVQNRQLASSAEFSEGPGSEYPGLFTFSLSPNANISNQELLLAFDEEVRNFINSPISEDLLKIAKRAIFTSYLSRLDSNLDMAGDLASALQIYQDYYAPIKWLEQVDAVSIVDIKRVAKQYLEKSQRTIGMVNSEQR